MKKCTICGDKITGEEISEWWADGEEFQPVPLICPDCYDRRNRRALEDRFEALMKEGAR